MGQTEIDLYTCITADARHKVSTTVESDKPRRGPPHYVLCTYGTPRCEYLEGAATHTAFNRCTSKKSLAKMLTLQKQGRFPGLLGQSIQDPVERWIRPDPFRNVALPA